MNVINDLINELMFQNNVTINDICEETGLSFLTVNKIVNNNVSPTAEVADVILRFLGESLEEVLRLY